MATVVVTGAAGFLGSNLCAGFLRRGSRVIAVDNLLTGRLENLNGLMKHPAFHFLERDVVHEWSVDGPVDAVLHFASPASPRDYLEYPIQTMEAGSLGTQRALELARAKNARFLLASTSEVYGDPLVIPQDETYWGNVNPIGPRSVYDEAKRFAEALAMAYHRVYSIDVKIARIFNTYGPGMSRTDGRAIPTFVDQALRGEPVTVFRSGRQTRSFCYVTDQVRGLMDLLDSDHSGPMNIGSVDEYPILEVARLVIEVAGSRSVIVHRGAAMDDPQRRRPDTALASSVIGWAPQVSLPDGLGRTIHWLRSQAQNPGSVEIVHSGG